MALGSGAEVRRLFLTAEWVSAPVTGLEFNSNLLTVVPCRALGPLEGRLYRTSRTRYRMV
jgi:hypothetical protein